MKKRIYIGGWKILFMIFHQRLIVGSVSWIVVNVSQSNPLSIPLRIPPINFRSRNLDSFRLLYILKIFYGIHRSHFRIVLTY